MKLNTKFAASTAILLALAACGGSSSSTDAAGDVSRIITGADALNIGTTSTTESANGLPFAIEGAEIDPEGGLPGATVRLVRFISDNQTGETVLQVTEEFATITTFQDEEGLSGTLTFNGETVVFVEGEGQLDDGTDIFIFVNQGGDWSAVISPYSYAYYDDEDGMSPSAGLNTEGSFVVGLQTNPNNMPTEMGTTTYSGEFSGYGTLLDLEGEGGVIANEVGISGGTILNAAFGDGNIGGSLFFGTEGIEGDLIEENVFAELELTEADILGNGFVTDANTVLECGGINCTSATQIGGAFFGPNGEEIAGTAGIDFSQENEGGSVRFVGAGGFIATVGEDF